MKGNTTYDWGAAWLATLAELPQQVWFTDLDGTLWGDILVYLNEKFGPIDPATGDKKWRQYDRAYKVSGTMTNGAHLAAEYRDLFADHSLEELVAWVKANVPLMPGAAEFVQMLTVCQVGIVGISNGARQIAQPKLDHHSLPLRLMSNWFEGTTIKFVHDEDVGIDKGLLIAKAHEQGYEVVGFSGDAKGDIEGARVTAQLGGLVLAYGQGGLADWCQGNLQPNQWRLITDFWQAMRLHELQARIGGR